MNRRQLCLLLLLAAAFSGCHKKRPKVPPATPPPQTSAQTIPPQVAPPQVPPLPQVSAAPAPVTTASSQPPRKSPHRIPHLKPKSNPAPEQTKTTASAAPPSALSSPEVTTSTDGTDGQHETEVLLRETDASIDRLARARTPSPDESDTIQQIRSYEKDARDAIRLEDYIRAHTLAQKAHLLAVTLRP